MSLTEHRLAKAKYISDKLLQARGLISSQGISTRGDITDCTFAQRACAPVGIKGDNNTTTIPTNQNSAPNTGNFCGNSFTFLVTNPEVPASLVEDLKQQFVTVTAFEDMQHLLTGLQQQIAEIKALK